MYWIFFFDGKDGFLYNGIVNIRLDFPCQREFLYFEIDFVGWAFEWPGICGGESINQPGQTDFKFDRWYPASWAVLNMTSLGLTILLA